MDVVGPKIQGVLGFPRGVMALAMGLLAAQRFLDAQGIKIDMNVLDLLIEAAVFKEFGQPVLLVMGG